MFILEKPYISSFLLDTLEKNSFPVLATDTARKLSEERPLNWVSEKDAVDHYRSESDARLYTTSENAIGWIAENSVI